MASNDPDFERRKAAEIIGLYLHPPQHAAVSSPSETPLHADLLLLAEPGRVPVWPH
jgi:hypothetical protein